MYEPISDWEYDWDGDPGEADASAAAFEELYDDCDGTCTSCGRVVENVFDLERVETPNFDRRLPSDVVFLCEDCY